MRIRKGRVVGNLLILLAVIFLVVGLIMPYYKTPQHLGGTGPRGGFSPNRTYWIDTYIVPPIDAGSPVNLNVLSEKPGAAAVLLALYDPATQTISGPPLVNALLDKDQKGLVVFTTATRTGPYMLMITSYNASFIFYLDSVWSPFYAFRATTTYGLALLPMGFVVLYYDSVLEKRQRVFEESVSDKKRST